MNPEQGPSLLKSKAQLTEIRCKYICIICNESFDSENRLRLHIESKCDTVRRYRCKPCGKTFISVNSFAFHLRSQGKTHKSSKTDAGMEVNKGGPLKEIRDPRGSTTEIIRQKQLKKQETDKKVCELKRGSSLKEIRDPQGIMKIMRRKRSKKEKVDKHLCENFQENTSSCNSSMHLSKYRVERRKMKPTPIIVRKIGTGIASALQLSLALHQYTKTRDRKRKNNRPNQAFLSSCISLSNQPEWKCYVCNTVFKHKYHLQQHKDSNCGTVTQYKCGVCHQEFSRKESRSFTLHQMYNHKKFGVTLPSSKDSIKSVNAEARIGTIEKNANHKQSEDGKSVAVNSIDKSKPLIYERSRDKIKLDCVYCEERFVGVKQLHEGPFDCNECGKRFSAVDVIRHFNAVITDKKHLCHLCGAAFLSKFTLFSHVGKEHPTQLDEVAS